MGIGEIASAGKVTETSMVERGNGESTTRWSRYLELQLDHTDTEDLRQAIAAERVPQGADRAILVRPIEPCARPRTEPRRDPCRLAWQGHVCVRWR